VNRLSAAAALGRGAANLRANRELVLVAAGGSVAIGVIVVLSVLPWLATLGLDLDTFSEPTDLGRLREFFGGLQSPQEILARLGGLLLSVTLAFTLATFLYCWYFGGILGVLVAGDAQAPPGAGREPAIFRTFSLRFFVHEAGRLLWRVFLYLNLFFLFWTLLLVLVVIAIAGAGLLGTDSGFAAGCAVACGALLPVAFVSFALLAAMELGQADLVRPQSGVLAATGAGFRALSRRLGASALVLLLLVVASVAIATAAAAVEFVVDVSLSGAPAFALKAILLLVRLVVGAVVNLAITAAFVALFRDDAARNAAPAVPPVVLGVTA
jgi:hypothetical protein